MLVKLIVLWLSGTVVWIFGYFIGFAFGYNKGVNDERKGVVDVSE